MEAAAELQKQPKELQQAHERSAWSRVRQVAAIGASAIALAGIGPAASSATEAPGHSPEGPPKITKPADLPPTITATFKTEASSAKVEVADFAKQRIRVLSNVSTKPMPRKRVERLTEEGKCRTFDGKKHDIRTYGLGVNGGAYGQDFRKSFFCFVNGHWVRFKCRNPAIIRRRPPQPKPERKDIFVRTFVNAKAKVQAKAVAVAECNTGGAKAQAYASAKSRVHIVPLKALVRARGRNVIRIQNQTNMDAWAKANAKVDCNSTEKTVTIVTPEASKPNTPPKGDVRPPKHMYAGGIGKICVDNIYDKEGDPVKAHDFRVYREGDPHKQGMGSFTGSVYPEAGGAQCQDYQAPYVTKDTKLTAAAKLSDGKSSADATPGNFPVLADDFGDFAFSRMASSSGLIRSGA